MSAQAARVDVEPQEAAPAPGTIVASAYRVEARIGSGGMGTILRATELSSGRNVAIKVMTAAAAADAEQVARFRREAKAVSSLTSEHVVRLLDHGELDSGAPYLVMEHLEGMTLADVVKEHGALPIPRAVDYVLQAIHGIAEAHTLGIVHRDLKPANLFVVGHAVEGDAGSALSSTVKVLDFGASKLTAESPISPGDPGGVTVASSLIGSPRYMAPEQIRSALEVDARADIYALGATLHELLSGKPIFFADSLARVFAQVLWDAPAPLSESRDDVPAELAAIIARCLAKAPAARFATVEALAAALAPFGASGEQARVVPPPPPRSATVRMARVKTTSDAPKRTVKLAAFALAPRLTPGAGAIPSSPVADALVHCAQRAHRARTARMERFEPPRPAAGRASPARRPSRALAVAALAVLLAIVAVAFVARTARHRAHVTSSVAHARGTSAT